MPSDIAQNIVFEGTGYFCDQDFKRELKTGFYNAPAVSQNVPMHFDFLKKIKDL